MKYIQFSLSLFAFLFLLWACNRNWRVGEGAKESLLPPLGHFLCPSTGFWQNAEAELPRFSSHVLGDAELGKLQVHFDERLVPHIFAKNIEDAYFAQGYTTAALRLWQMEFQTHAAAGRLTEFLGSTDYRRELLLARDKEKRRSGLPRAAAAAAAEWKKEPELYKRLQRYADGVNTYIKELSYRSYPLEYKILGYAPEPWSVEKTALLLKAMAETLTSKDEDFEMTNAYRFLGRERFLQLYPEYFPEQSPVILDSAWTFESQGPSKWGPAVRPFFGPSADSSMQDSIERSPKGLGSNNWALAGSRTASGFPMLCNDPHLKLNLPSIWFEVHISTPEMNVYGASLPGAPGVISGFNEYAAWGITNVAHDVRDWYAIEWEDASRKRYMLDSNWVDAKHYYDTIRVRDEGFVVDTLIYTQWGPIAYSLGAQDYALRWTALDPSYEPKTFFILNQAKSYEEYKEAISYFSCPAQNIVFASKEGDIALWTQGKLPMRKPGQGKFVQDGRYSSNAWAGFIPQEHIPHEHNPRKGFVSSANQHSVNPNSYPYYYYGYFEEYRGRHLNNRLAALEQATAEDMIALQNDNFGMKAKDFLPLMMKHIQRGTLTKDELEVLAKLRDWDYNYKRELLAPSIFEDWFALLQEYLYDEIAEINQREELKGKQTLLPPYEWTSLRLLKSDTLNPIWDIVATANRESYTDVVTESFRELCRRAYSKGTEAEIPTWTNKRNTRILHLAQIEPFSVTDLELDGHSSALNAMTHRNGPSWRMLVELGEENKGKGVYPGGQSGNPGSKYYLSMLQTWAKGEYYDLLAPAEAEGLGQKSIFLQEFGH